MHETRLPTLQVRSFIDAGVQITNKLAPRSGCTRRRLQLIESRQQTERRVLKARAVGRCRLRAPAQCDDNYQPHTAPLPAPTSTVASSHALLLEMHRVAASQTTTASPTARLHSSSLTYHGIIGTAYNAYINHQQPISGEGRFGNWGQSKKHTVAKWSVMNDKTVQFCNIQLGWGITWVQNFRQNWLESRRQSPTDELLTSIRRKVPDDVKRLAVIYIHLYFTNR